MHGKKGLVDGLLQLKGGLDRLEGGAPLVRGRLRNLPL